MSCTSSHTSTSIARSVFSAASPSWTSVFADGGAEDDSDACDEQNKADDDDEEHSVMGEAADADEQGSDAAEDMIARRQSELVLHACHARERCLFLIRVHKR